MQFRINVMKPKEEIENGINKIVDNIEIPIQEMENIHNINEIVTVYEL